MTTVPVEKQRRSEMHSGSNGLNCCTRRLVVGGMRQRFAIRRRLKGASEDTPPKQTLVIITISYSHYLQREVVDSGVQDILSG